MSWLLANPVELDAAARIIGARVYTHSCDRLSGRRYRAPVCSRVATTRVEEGRPERAMCDGKRSVQLFGTRF